VDGSFSATGVDMLGDFACAFSRRGVFRVLTRGFFRGAIACDCIDCVEVKMDANHRSKLKLRIKLYALILVGTSVKCLGMELTEEE